MPIIIQVVYIYIHMSEKTKTISLFQDEKTGKLVEFIHKHDEDYAKVKDTSGVISYVPLDHLVPYDREKGRLAKIGAPLQNY